MRIGILGYGQLGRLLAMAGIPLGFSFDFYDASTQSIYRSLTPSDDAFFSGSSAFDRFLEESSIITYETENTSEELVNEVSSQKNVFPSKEALVVAQHRIKEKTFCQELNIPVTHFKAIQSLSDCFEAAEVLGFPLVFKTVTMGYDGKGQRIVHQVSDIEAAWKSLNNPNLIAEQWVSFEHECSLIAVRGKLGEILYYPLVENTHREGILRVSQVRPHHPLTEQAQEIAEKILEALQYVGILTIEFFVTSQGLLVNEMAPRVHNSGHWSIEGAMTSQFANHIRAIAGLPLGGTELRAPFVGMCNIIGEPVDMEQVLEIPGAYIHWYGKEPRPGRKLGHITLIADDEASFDEKFAELVALL